MPRQRSRAVVSSSRICVGLRPVRRSRSSVALSASPSTPIVSGWRVHSSGVAIERYWWMRANVIGCAKRRRRRGCVGSSAASPSAIRVRVPREHVAQLLVVEAGEPRRAQRDAAASSAGCPYG